ncbi:hypothetical protein ACUXOR_001104 [Staphylococcus pasteuri]|uniref:SRPBCC domain-containing protein n=1 Tax=Staphylococcus pasteuri_A TaxID=3062664 RepID=A0AAW7YU90_9STAP|nr:SRPBCC domain-containing protein [Staphylococcus pasteuri_A]MDO6574904.1 SRPBCC domain-containing protein [Staphylococcus pasteuri_A]
MLNEIKWPEKWLPGTTDNFASNEIIVKDLSFDNVIESLLNTSKWENYYSNSSDIYMYNQDSPVLKQNTRFKFKTFGFDIEAEVEECMVEDNIARIAWHGWNNATGDEFLDFYHAWLIEKLSHNRLRILTQESQIGKPAKDMASDNTYPMINGHQEWITTLANFSM